MAERKKSEPEPSLVDLSIRVIKTNKSKVASRPLMDQGVIPKGISSVIFNGRSGSGKSTLLVNLLSRPEFFGPPGKRGYFDEIHLFAPTGGTDDMFDSLKIPLRNVHMKPTARQLESLMKKQKKVIDRKGVDKAPKMLVILEDCQSCKRFLGSEAVKQAFIANRHFNMSTWICGQSFTLTPRACRLQANNIFYFRGSGSEKKLMIDEFCPSGLTKAEFADLVGHAVAEPYSFLHINMGHREETRFRKGLGVILSI